MTATATTIRVLITDDHALVRAGIHALLDKQPHMEVVAEASNGREALRLVREYKPHVVLMDIAMPELNGLEAVRLLAKEFPRVHCIILSMYADAGHAWQGSQSCATAYLVMGAT